MHPSARQSVEPRYEIHPDDWEEIDGKEGEGWVFIHAEHDLSKIGKETGVVDVAGQCALGNVEKVLLCDLDAICKATRQSVELRLYFVERWQFEESCRQKARRRREREQQQRTTSYIGVK